MAVEEDNSKYSRLAGSRKALKDVLLFRNLYPVRTLYRGDEAEIAEAVREVKETGVAAVWPGCDLVIQTPSQNLQTLFNDYRTS